MIKLENLQKIFRTEEVETVALNNVSLSIDEKEFVAVMGPSGCGKSTLLNILGLLDNPTSGEYYLAGTEVGNMKERERTETRKGTIGFVFQSFNLIEEMNVSDNVALPLIYMGVPAHERKERVQQVLHRMKIDHRSRHFPNQLSGGRVSVVSGYCICYCSANFVVGDERLVREFCVSYQYYCMDFCSGSGGYGGVYYNSGWCAGVESSNSKSGKVDKDGVIYLKNGFKKTLCFVPNIS